MKAFLFSLTCVVLTPGFGAPSTPDQRKDACCEAMKSGTFTANSLYQAEVSFTADNGKVFDVGQLRGRPVVLAMFFASCGYACPLIVSDMLAIQAKLPGQIRQSTAFVLVSFDTQRDTPAALANYRQQHGLGEPWVLLHGGADSVRELAALLGLKYKQEPDGAFSHSNLITILNSEGEIIHQREGLNGGLDEAAAVVIASQNHH
jgi:protein SCO1/2